LVDCEGTAVISEEKIARAVQEVFPLTPKGIIKHLDMLRPIYKETAHDGHFGRKGKGFTWEKPDHVDELKKALKM